MAFREQDMMVFQIQLTKRQGVVPMTRDYIAREEARLRDVESGTAPAAAARRRIARSRSNVTALDAPLRASQCNHGLRLLHPGTA